ncbi:MAG: ACP S-malonyltransferase [Candidatus Omnitrophica bacterium]|nr:ACP S-malonyltransferase [Candidatus Omnitrophota bacterium]MDD5670647.1 ACP S-malonyltransferase [Candidatus Omnitrophota bacterium]
MIDKPLSAGFLFPGQGAQSIGMGKDFYDQSALAKKIFDGSNQILGYDLAQICLQGPEDKLTRTLYAQPAIFVTSYVALSLLRERFPELNPVWTAGLSLGEFTSLVAAGALSFEDGLKLVAARADAMENAGQSRPGTMASIIGLSLGDCEALAREAGCEVANLNSPDQFALSGTFESIEKVCKLAETQGAKRAIPLKVGGAFHSSLMIDAKEALEKALVHTPVRSPACTFIPNVTAQRVTEPSEIKMLLAKQLMSPVRWIETMARAKESGVRYLIEIGPGRVLKGLARKCEPSLNVLNCGTAVELQKLDEVFGKIGTK